MGDYPILWPAAKWGVRDRKLNLLWLVSLGIVGFVGTHGCSALPDRVNRGFLSVYVPPFTLGGKLELKAISSA